MKRRDWFVVLALVAATWIIDQVTKTWANNMLSELHFYGPFGFVLHHNRGAILGTFSDLPPLLRVVSLSTGGAFLIFIYGTIQYLLPARHMQLRTGMSLLLGGILGNVTDRIAHGEVTDFILLGSRTMWTPAFNMADAIQWVGYGLVVYGLIRDGNLLWPDVNARRSLWVNPSYQLRYCLTIVAIGASFALMNGVFAYTFLKVTIDDLVVGPARMTEHRFLIPFLQTYSVIAFGFLIALFMLARVLSHRTAGPVYAFESFVRDLIVGKKRPFKLRKADDFQHLAELAELLRPILSELAARDGGAGLGLDLDLGTEQSARAESAGSADAAESAEDDVSVLPSRPKQAV